MAYFMAKHKEVIGQPYLVSHGKDQKIIKEVVNTYGTFKTIKMIMQFFQNLKTDEFLKKSGATIGVFRSQIPKLILQTSDTEDKSNIGKL